MNQRFSLFKLYTNLKEVKDLLFKESVQIVYERNLIQQLRNDPPSVRDLLIVSDESFHLIESFPGLVIVKNCSNQISLEQADAHQLIMLSPHGFSSSLMTVLDIKYRWFKINKERNSMMNQLDLAIKEFNECQIERTTIEKEQEQRLAMLNHELKTPLNVIMGHVSLLQDSLLTKNQAAYVNRIQKASRMLHETLDEILFYEDTLKDIKEMQSKKFNLIESLEDMHLVYKSFAEEKNIGYEVQYDEKLTKMHIGDIHKIEMLSKQLLTNALKFTNQGHIIFTVKCVQDLSETQRVELIVEDTGIGFQMEQMDELFKPFKQGEHYLQRHYNGLGLGLTIIKNIVETLEGTIDVWSEKGEGSRFIIGLSLEKDPECSEHNHKIAHILVVDDNALNRKILKEMLEDEGVTVELARNGKEAVEVMRERGSEFNLILMDLIMPVMDGFEATKHIRKITQTIPIIVVTASIGELEVEKMKSLRIDDFMLKNHDVEAYLKVIRKYIDIPEIERNEKLKPEQLETLVNQPFKIIKIEALLQRYNHKLGLVLKIVEGVILQLDQFEINWQMLLKDSHNEEAMRYLHSVKGLVKSIGDMTLGKQFEAIEKEMRPEDYTNEVNALTHKRIQKLQEELRLIVDWVKNQEEPEITNMDMITKDDVDLRTLMETLVGHLKVHDVKQIRSCMKLVQNKAKGTSCEHQIEILGSMLDRYQYENAEEWILERISKRGDGDCSI